MDLSQLFQTLAVLVEVSVTAIGVLIAVQNRRVCGWFIAGTFGLFVLFDIIRIFALPVPADVNGFIFLVACCLMLAGAWFIYGER